MTASRSPRLVVHVSIPNVPAVLAEEAEQADDAGPVCGWYESSWALRQGLADKFLAEQLHPAAFEAACSAVGQPLTLRRHAGYDHGYYFIASVIDDHLRHHAAQLGA